MFSFKKKQAFDLNSFDASDMKERLFFHDIINHTHGLVLFLHQKELQKENIKVEEVKMISDEIKTLQSLIRDHYDFKHKNLVQTLDWVPFSYAKIAFNNMCQTYLTDKKLITTFDVIEATGAENLLYYPIFYRILNNLVKNISESNASLVNFEFRFDEFGLEVISKNEMRVNGENELPEHLARVILNENNPKIVGLGLESIHHLAEENGGTFSFEITDSVWINRLFLPSSKIKSDKISA